MGPGPRRTHVHRGEDGEDVRLEQSDQDIERHQRHRHEKARERDEKRHDQVPRHHVPEQAHGEGERTRELRDHVERREKRVRAEVPEQVAA